MNDNPENKNEKEKIRMKNTKIRMKNNPNKNENPGAAHPLSPFSFSTALPLESMHFCIDDYILYLTLEGIWFGLQIWFCP